MESKLFPKFRQNFIQNEQGRNTEKNTNDTRIRRHFEVRTDIMQWKDYNTNTQSKTYTNDWENRSRLEQ